MSRKEAKRVFVIEQVVDRKITIKQAALLLNLSERQVKRLKKGVQEHGIGFLAHKNRGRKPKHTIPQPVRKLVVSLARNDLQGASSQHMAELLAEHYGTSISPRSIRRIMAEAGIDNPHSHKSARRRRSRDRMPKEGMLVQLDASPFAWLEDRGPWMSLHAAIDDATCKVLGAHFRLQEDAIGHFQVLSQVVLKHGVPQGLYTDLHTIFFSPKKDKLSIEEELAGKTVSLTQFGRALEELGINHIPARSPQAKGRIERLWRTLQHRLVIELRLAGVSSLEEANAFLPAFIARFNDRFSVAPADSESAFSPSPPAQKLQRIICFKETRKASKGSTISYSGCTYRLVDHRGKFAPLQPRSKVFVLVHLDGSLSAVYDDKHFDLEPFTPPKPIVTANAQKKSRRPYRPGNDHPWKNVRSTKRWLPEPIDRYLDAQAKRAFWEEIYAQR